MVYLAGCIGNDDQGKLVEGTIQDRTRRALFNAERRLQSVGLDLSDGMSSWPGRCWRAENSLALQLLV